MVDTMRHILRRSLAAAVVALVTTGLLVCRSAPALAWPVTSFLVCQVSNCSGGAAQTYGSITWYNRTAGTAGQVVAYCCASNHQTTRAVFDAYAGTTKIDTKSVDTYNVASPTSFGPITIGDTNLRGGINHIKITVCVLFTNTGWLCGPPTNYNKPPS
jgi:hypothetical protein